MKGAPPLFSLKWLRNGLITALIVIIIGIPSLQFSLGPVRGADPTYSVTIIDYAFQPLHINITTGTTVMWTYAPNGGDRHTVTSRPGTNTTQGGAPLLNSGQLNPGQSFSYAFSQPGFYPYYCAFHPTTPSMNSAWVNVTGAPVTPPPSQNPQPDYTLITAVGGIVAAIIVTTVVLFVRRKNRKAPVAPPPTQSTNP